MMYLRLMALLAVITLHAQEDVLVQGKTKIVRRYLEDPTLAIFESKDDITAGDGAKHDIIAGKAALATTTTCNVFKLLQACNIPVAFKKQLDKTKFLAPYCTMVPYEVVVRREAHGSYLKRNPTLQKGHYFPQLIVEFFLKTTDKQWKGQLIPKDDPLIQFCDGKAQIYLPDVPLFQQKPFMILDDFPLYDQHAYFEKMSEIAQYTFLILEKAWQLIGARLVDFKVEFGFDAAGNLLLADVIDNDSWRVIYEDGYIDKQVYREGGDLNKVNSLYQLVAQLTAQFKVPRQRIIVWRGSESDDITSLRTSFESFQSCGCTIAEVTKSAHKDPVRCCTVMQQLVQEIPDTVLLALVGASNAAGPILSAQSSIPVITIPASWQQFPEDVWSSLRMPRNVPVMTVLSPQNGLLAALEILALRNPALYAKLRFEQEKRLVNIIQIN